VIIIGSDQRGSGDSNRLIIHGLAVHNTMNVTLTNQPMGPRFVSQDKWSFTSKKNTNLISHFCTYRPKPNSSVLCHEEPAVVANLISILPVLVIHPTMFGADIGLYKYTVLQPNSFTIYDFRGVRKGT
jgi:hypothetical protein